MLQKVFDANINNIVNFALIVKNSIDLFCFYNSLWWSVMLMKVNPLESAKEIYGNWINAQSIIAIRGSIHTKLQTRCHGYWTQNWVDLSFLNIYWTFKSRLHRIKILKSVRITHDGSSMVCKQYIILKHVLSDKTASFPKVPPKPPFPRHFPSCFLSHFQSHFPSHFLSHFPKYFLRHSQGISWGISQGISWGIWWAISQVRCELVSSPSPNSKC